MECTASGTSGIRENNIAADAGNRDKDLKESGKVSYCGHELSEFVPQRTCSYISQHDLHHGEMTVREALDFSGRCLGFGAAYELLAELLRQENEAGIKPDPEIDAFMKATAMAGQETSLVTDYVLKTLGLDICADIMVGDEMTRGISGGQKKRVTIGEMLVGPAKALFMDEISTEGQIIYQGPRENVLEFFKNVGSDCPERRVADFLQEVTSKKDQEQYWCKKNEPYRYTSVPEFVNHFHNYHIGKKLSEELGIPYDRSKAHPAALVTEKYGISNWELFEACFARKFFSQLLAFFGAHQMALSLFRFIGALGRVQVVSDTLGTFTLLLVFVLGGFIAIKDDIAPWMIWGYYISYMMYGQNAIAINEFLDKRSSSKLANSHFVPLKYLHLIVFTFSFLQPNPDPSIPEPTVRKVLLRNRGMFKEDYWYWICVGTLLGFSVLFNICFIIALTFLNPLGDSKFVIVEEDDNKKSGKQSSNGQLHMRGIEMSTSSTAPSFQGIGAMKNTPDNSIRSATENAPTRKGMVLPFQPLSLAFNHVNYYVNMLAEMKSQGIEESRLQLLQEVSGAFMLGILTALVGVSGAGKTTLMDVLAGRKTGRYIKEMFVEEVMDLVKLNPLRNSIVGLPGVDGLSTEQRNRLTIAIEFVANPSIIFIDEPTSSLDARAAAIVMRTLLLLMKRGGQVIFAGPLGHHSHKLVEYFEAIPTVLKIKDGYNPATWMLEISSPVVEGQLDVDFAEIYANSELFKRNQELNKELSTPAPGSKDLYFPTKYSQSFVTQSKACFWKQYWSYWRNARYNTIRFLMTIVIGVIFGLIFWKKGDKTQKEQDLLNLLGAMYATLLFLGSANAAAVQSVVAIERTVFYRERAAGMHSALPYALAQVAVEIIYVAIQTFAYTLILYSMIGFHCSDSWPPNCCHCYVLPKLLEPLLWFSHPKAGGITGVLQCLGHYGLVTSQVGEQTTPIEVPGQGYLTVKYYLKSRYGFEYDFLGAVVVAHVGFILLFFFVFVYGIKFLNFQRR
ncbi:pleiotropic drug resistance protein 2 [Quercus suber]|uniref:Pleiotropic drug resistance protein 2 n=1 Tax=Quercus suber TaxID=58331 RepID=A0AAW0M531_QUESU